MQSLLVMERVLVITNLIFFFICFVGGVLLLPESNVSDEEVHTLSAMLRDNPSIVELNLRRNNITDDGARALGAVLAGKSNLRLVDLRGNKIGPGAIRILAEALERAERVKHVYVHQGGKIEALGTNTNTSKEANAVVTVETVCVVDIRDNTPQSGTDAELSSTNGKLPGSKSMPSFTPGGMVSLQKATAASSDLAISQSTKAKASSKKPKKSEAKSSDDSTPTTAHEPPVLSAKQLKKLKQKVSDRIADILSHLFADGAGAIACDS